MADYDQLLSFLKETPSTATNAPATNTPSPAGAMTEQLLAPLSRQAQAAAGQLLQNVAPSAVTAQGNLSWFDRNQRKDETGLSIPIDTESGINLGDFGRMVWQRRPEERLAVLRKMFPNQVVRLADTGEPIVEVPGPAGTRKDVLVNPPGFNAADLIEIGSSAPEMAGGAIGMGLGTAGGGAIAGPPGAFAGRVIGGAAGAAIGGVLKDVTAREAESLPLNMSEIGAERSKEAALNALFDVGLSGGAKGLRAFSPFAGEKGPLEFNLQKAVDYFKNVHGENFKTTPGEASGSTLLRRIEATEAPQPGASTILGHIQTEGEQAISRVFNAALGRRVGDEAVGADLINTMQREITQPAAEAVAQARNDLIKRGEGELVNTIDSIAPGAATRQEAGEAIRTEFAAAQKVAKGKVDAAYAAVRALPGGTGKVLPGDPVALAAGQIEDELPKVLKTKSVQAFDAYGNPIERKVVKPEVLASGRPEGLMTFLQDMKAQKGQGMSLDELTRLKNAAHDEIAKTEAVPDVKDRWFGLVQRAYDDAIDQGVANMPDKKLANALETARTTYKQELLPLDRQGLSDILRRPTESGYQAPEQLVSRLFTGTRAEHNYRALQETLGAGSPAFTKIKSSLLNSWLVDAGDPLTGRIDPGKLEQAFTALRGAHPEIYRDVIGGSANEQRLFQTMRSLKAAGGEVGDLDQRELAALLSRGNPTRAELQQLQAAQRARDTTLADTALKSVDETGTLGNTTPVDFVNSLFNTSLPTPALEKRLAALSPGQLDDLRTAALYRIASKASTFKSDYAPAYIEGLQSGIGAKGLVNALGDPGSLERARNELLLGPKNVELVQQTINALSPREIKTGLFRAAGGMAATGTIEKLLKVPLQYATTWAKKALIATAYTSEPAKAILLNEVAGPRETAALANMLVASEPFLRKLHDTLGEDAAYSVVKDLKRSIDRSIVQDTQPSQSAAQFSELSRFLQTGQGKIKTNTVP